MTSKILVIVESPGKIKKIQDYLHRGDIYEVNYCIPFIIKTDTLDLIDIY